MGADLNYHKDDYKFYLKYYYLLCEEIETLPEGKLKNELEITKYRLMMILDGYYIKIFYDITIFVFIHFIIIR